VRRRRMRRVNRTQEELESDQRGIFSVGQGRQQGHVYSGLACIEWDSNLWTIINCGERVN